LSHIDRVGSGKSYHEIAGKGRPVQSDVGAGAPRDEVSIEGSVSASRASRVCRSSAKKGIFKSSGEAQKPKKWTILYYLCGNNNIARDMIVKAGRLEQTGSTERMDIVIQTGQPAESPYPGATRFHLQKAPQGNWDEPDYGNEDPYRVYGERKSKDEPYQKLFSKPVESLGPVDMSDSKVLQDFITWGMKNYPAERYMVVLMDHGYGFMGTLQDDSSNRVMSLPEVEKALKGAQARTGKKIDVLGLDSCLMQQAEAAYQLKDAAKYLVASEEVEYPFGWPEGNIAANLDTALKLGPVTPRKAAEIVVQSAAKDSDEIKTLSAIKLRNMEYVKVAMDALARALIATDVPKETARRIIEETHNYCTVLPDDKLCTNYRDVYDFAERLLKAPDMSDRDVKKAAVAVIDALSDAVVAETHKGEGKEGSHGLAAYLPSTGFLPEYEGFIPEDKGPKVKFPPPSQRYADLSFARSSMWDELIKSLKT
jgi:hypothetical protein